MNNKNISFEDAIKFAQGEEHLLKKRNNNFRLSDFQIAVLDRIGLNYMKYSNIHDLLFDIEDELNSNYDEELDLVSSQISEYIYYIETKK